MRWRWAAWLARWAMVVSVRRRRAAVYGLLGTPAGELGEDPLRGGLRRPPRVPAGRHVDDVLGEPGLAVGVQLVDHRRGVGGVEARLHRAPDLRGVAPDVLAV